MPAEEEAKKAQLDQLKLRYARLLIAGDPTYDHATLDLDDDIAEHAVVHETEVNDGILYTFNAIFGTKQDAINARLAMMNDDTRSDSELSAVWLVSGLVGEIRVSAKVYAWTTRTTSNPFEVDGSGMSVISIEFDSTCLDSGCWAIAVQYITPKTSSNVFYLPKVTEADKTGDDNDPYDGLFQYKNSVVEQFQPRLFPCGTQGYSQTDGALPLRATGCCMPRVPENYRPTQGFVDWLDANPDLMENCEVTPWAKENAPVFNTAPTEAGLTGGFPGLDTSYVEYTGPIDQFANLHTATFYLDEIEFRTYAGMLSGTVGVEYVVDSFVGMVTFMPTGLPFLDSFAVQTRLHVEKTNFFTVSTWGYYGPVPVGREDNCYGPECWNDVCDPLDNCCQGLHCLECQGPDCGQPSCIGDVCCIGPDCVEETCEEGANCCIGPECEGCVGPECEEPKCGGTKCCIGPDCEDDNCPPDGNCCEGPDCDQCLGPDCRSPGCFGDDCCKGEDCCTDGNGCTLGECTGKNCCAGPDCDNCVGLNCVPRECEGDECCKGTGCEGGKEDDPTCNGRGNCCFGPECDNCVGEDCIPAPCVGDDCCYGVGCTEQGVCTGIGDCCSGDGCGLCTGADCQANSCAGPDCCMGPGCEPDGSCPGGNDCCVGEECNDMTCGTDGVTCCRGPGCEYNAQGGTCPSGGQCCQGSGCDTCSGPDCRFYCTGDDCCIGTGCNAEGECQGEAGSGTCCTTPNGGTAEHFSKCNSCTGDDCGAGRCVGADCCMGEDCCIGDDCEYIPPPVEGTSSGDESLFGTFGPETGGSNTQGPIGSCEEQDKCMKWEVTQLDEGCTDCKIQVCLVLDDGPKCTKFDDGSSAISHRCTRPDDPSCSFDAVLAGTVREGWVKTEAAVDNRPGAAGRQCQTGNAGETLHFVLKDGSSCAGSGFTSAVSGATCTAGQVCMGQDNGNGGGNGGGLEECIWSYTLPSECVVPPEVPEDTRVAGGVTCSYGDNCCVGLYCNQCHGRDCEDPQCMGEDCCQGPSCNDLFGGCSDMNEDGSNCCEGLECDDSCAGPDCAPLECEGEGQCCGENCVAGTPEDPTPTCDGGNCCFGSNCTRCSGLHCTEPRCEGDDCCKGADCLPDGSCPTGGNCCEGAECDTCHGVDCQPPKCYGTGCCYGEGCNPQGTGTCLPEGDCCIGDECHLCFGECCEGFCPGEGNADAVIQEVNPRIHQVSLDSRSDGTGGASKMQYVSLTMTVGDQFDANPRGGAVPVRGVLSGKGEAYSKVDLLQACSELYAGETKYKFESALGLDCAPAARMCESIYSIPDQTLTFNIPLGDEWFRLDGDDSDASLTSSFKIFVDTIISLVDKTSGIKAYAQVLAEVPLVRGGVARWCDEESAKVDLVEVAGAHLLVGTVGLDSEFDRLRKWFDVQSSVISPQGPTEIDTDSIESGLMTLVLYGKDEYFGDQNSRSSTFSLELEDVLTVHIMEEFDVYYNLVMELVNKDQAVSVTFDRWGLHAHLDPTANLTYLCPFYPRMPSVNDPFPATCVTRRDRKRRVDQETNLIKTVIELTEGDVAKEEAGDYMQTVLGSSDYARDIGRNFSQIIRKRYNVNDQFNRAFWINPGYQWMPQTFGTRFTISQRLLMFCLINLDEGFDQAVGGPAGRRKVLMTQPTPPRRTTTDKANNEMSSFNMKYDMDQFKMYMEFLQVDVSQVSMWSISTRLTDEQICMSTDELKVSLRMLFKQYVDGVSRDVKDLHISAVTISGADGFDCSGAARRRSGRKLLKFNPTAEAATTTMMVFADSPADGKLPFIDVNLLQQHPALTMARPERMQVCDANSADGAACIRLDDSTTRKVNDEVKNQFFGQEADDKKGGGGGGAPIGAIVGALVAVLVVGGLIFAAVRWQKKRREEAQELEVESVYVDPKMALRDEISADICVDAFNNFQEEPKGGAVAASAVEETRGSDSNSSGNREGMEELAKELRGTSMKDLQEMGVEISAKRDSTGNRSTDQLLTKEEHDIGAC